MFTAAVQAILVGLGVIFALILLSGIRWIPNTKVGVVEMRIIQTLASAEAERTRITGEGEAKRIQALLAWGR